MNSGVFIDGSKAVVADLAVLRLLNSAAPSGVAG